MGGVDPDPTLLPFTFCVGDHDFMKRTILLACLALTVVAFTVAQRKDLASDISVATTLTPNIRANSAATGAWVDLTGYGSAVAVLHRGLVEAATQYAVLQDSASGAALAAVDSVNIAADSTVTELGYVGTKRFVRILLRASGANGDSSWAGAVIVRGDCRRKPC